MLRSSCNVPDILSDFNQTWIIYTDFYKILYVKFHENPSSENGAETDERTVMTKAIGAFRYNANTHTD